jgi:hypothetical protein
VPSDLVLAFLRGYRFHEKSQECDAGLISTYIEKRIRNAGALRRWNVAIVGNPPAADDKNFEFAPGVSVGRIVRSRFGKYDPTFADIKTLMSRRDAAIDLDGETSTLEEDEIREQRVLQLPEVGLLVLYPIDRASDPDKSKRAKRSSLNTPDHLIGVGLVFPEPKDEDSRVSWESSYISANLAGVEIEEEDFSLLDSEEESA